jgi:hypothetical protein
VGGLFTLFIGLYLSYLRVEPLIALVVSTSGLSALISGIRYKERQNIPVLTAEQRTVYSRSRRFRVFIIGVVIFFSGLGMGLIAHFMHFYGAILGCLGVVFVGALLIFISKFFKDYSREIEKSD